MSNNAQKTPFAQSINRFAEQKIRGFMQLTGQALPCSVVSVNGSIVTVKFEITSNYTLPQVTVPVFGPEWIRYPIQVGDKGMVIPADAYLGGVSGLGTGTAGLNLPGNLSALIFMPIANANWSATDDANALVLYGPDGVVIRDKGAHCKIVLTPTNITVTVPGGQTVTINGMTVINGNAQINGNLQLSGAIQSAPGATYTGDIKTAGNVIAGFATSDQVGLTTHKHGGVQTGGGSTSSPTAGT
jgi:hypothetical protein